ncbi:HA-tagged protein kinase [Gongronella butleri]|nr:HA-tagged protein kinase [Gongronella butleri]
MRAPTPNSSPALVQWERGRLIGRGHFGAVYLAKNLTHYTTFAVKVINLNTTKTYQTTMNPLNVEIRLLAKLKHENIVCYLGHNFEINQSRIEERLLIFMEFVSGGSVASLLKEKGKFRVPVIRHFTRQVARGLAYIHGQMGIHRDIKAANILVNGQGVCKISDFGLSRINHHDEAYMSMTGSRGFSGSAPWMAPEAVTQQEKYSAKVDIWSFGCTVLEMATGERPWPEKEFVFIVNQVGQGIAPPIPEKFPADVREFINQCFVVNPKDRPTATDLLSHPFLQEDPDFDYMVKGSSAGN